MSQLITTSESYTYSVIPGQSYVFAIGYASSPLTVSLKWRWENGLANDTEFADGAFAADGGIEFTPPTSTIVVSADSGEGEAYFSIAEKMDGKTSVGTGYVIA